MVAEMETPLLRWVKRVGIVMGTLIAGLGGLLHWAAGGRQEPGEHRGENGYFGPPRRASASVPSSQPGAPVGAEQPLVVMSWNMAYARGTNPDNDSNEVASRSEILRRLREMGQLMRKVGADIVLLQEIDFRSKRSRYIDQLEVLAHASGLHYGARAVSWRARWVPHPLWPPTKHYGPVMSGGAVLSRFPITANRVVLYPKPEENGRLYNAFYLFRYSQYVSLRWAGRELLVVNNHLEAFKKANRQLQARLLARHLVGLGAQETRALLLVGGDFNTTPPEARKKHGFVDCVEDDYRDDATLATVGAVAGVRELVPSERYRTDEAAHFTFPTLAPTRRLDYLFFDDRIALDRYEIVATEDFSDHRPIVARLRFKPR